VDPRGSSLMYRRTCRRRKGGGIHPRCEGPQPFRSGTGHSLEGIGTDGEMDGEGEGGGTRAGNRPPRARSFAAP
jgi:hypothetical protein